MKKRTALTISVGVLAAVAMYLTATILPVGQPRPRRRDGSGSG